MNKALRLLVASVAIWSANFSVHGYTVEQLVGEGDYKDAADETYFSKYDRFGYEKAPLGHSSHIKLSKVIIDDRIGEYDRTKIKVEGFTGFTGGIGAAGFAKADFTFVLANENGEPDADGEYLYLKNDVRISASGWWITNYTASGPNASADGEYYITAGKHLNNPDPVAYQYSFGSSSGYIENYYDWYGKISETADGEYRIEFSDPAIMSSAADDPSAWISEWRTHQLYVIDHYAIETFTPNATFKCKVMPFTYKDDDRGVYGTAVEKEFPVKYTIDGEGNFKVLNLLGEGFAIGKAYDSMSAPTLYSGKYNSESGVATLDGGQQGWLNTVNRSYMTNRTIWHHGALTTVRTSNSIFDANFKDVVIKGSENLEEGRVKHLYHFVPKSYWVSNGGLCRTFISSGTMNLQPFAFVCYSREHGIYDSSSAYTDGEFDVHEDVTLGVDHQANVFARNATEFYVQTDMKVTKNDMHVESFELWMAPKGKSIDVNSGAFLHENGHEYGQMLAYVHASELNGRASFGAASRGANVDNHRFQVQRPLSTIVNKDENNKYIFYIKANYKPETGLSPTIHGLTAPEEVSTGVDVAEWCGGAKAEVKVVAGGIEVSGTDGVVEVFTPGGATVYSGAEGRIDLADGIYVVRVNGEAQKVAVR